MAPVVLLIPAIDLKDGNCVQLRQGAAASATVYSDDPPAMAKRWAAAGARRLHVVDLDGAFSGEPVHAGAVRDIVRAVPGVAVQVGGGIRSQEAANAYLQAGASQVIVGTRAIEEPRFLEQLAMAFPGRTALGLDARAGRLATRGWKEDADIDAAAFVAALGALPLFAIVYTDVARDGMLSGVNVAATERLAATAPAPVIASGGVRSLADLEALRALGLGASLLGAISGSALYEGTLDFAAGQRLLSGAPARPAS